VISVTTDRLVATRLSHWW